MPENMRNENEIFSVGGMPVTHVRKDEILIPESARVIKSITANPGREYEIGHEIKMLNPADPNYDPRLDAAMRGELGEPDRPRFERDPLGLYNPASNFGDSLLELSKIPLKGSAVYQLSVDGYVAKQTRMMERPKKGPPRVVTDDDRQRMREKAERLLDNKEAGIKDELERNFRMAVMTGDRAVTETIVMLESFVAPKPFEARTQEMHFDTSRKVLENMATYFEGRLDERVLPWYRVYDQVSEQQAALFKVLCAAGGGLEGYYDALKQAGETLISRARYHASMHDFRAAYTNDDPGVTNNTLTPEQRAHVKDTLASREVRELHVEMQSQARRLILFNVDVAQIDVDKPEGKDGLINHSAEVRQREVDRLTAKANKARAAGDVKRADRIQAHIDSIRTVDSLNVANHRDLMKLVFGNIDRNNWIKFKSSESGAEREVHTPEEILTWYSSSDKLEAREEWLAKMTSMLMWQSDTGESLEVALRNADPARVQEIANQIIGRSFDIRNNIGDKLMNADIRFKAATIAITSWIENDKGFQTAGPLAWAFVYKDIGGQVRRTYDTGGLYKAFDSVNLFAYWRRWVMYKAGWKSATQFFGPMSDDGRREIFQHGPDWLPPLMGPNGIDASPKIRRLHDRFFTDGNVNSEKASENFVLWRARRLTGNNKLTLTEMRKMEADGKLKPARIDDFFKKHLLENGWTFKSAYGVPIPMYMPKTFKINLEQMMYSKATKDTVWDLYRAGVMPKDIDWEEYNFETLDRMWVSMSMLTRFAKFFVDSYEAERDPQYQAFFKEASPQSIAEMSKRVYLAFRDLPEGYAQYIPAIVPFMIAQHAAKASGLLSADLGATKVSKEKIMKKWNFLMSQWIQACNFMPQVMLDDKQLYDGANAEIQSMRNDMTLMIMYYKHVFEKVGQAAYKADKSTLSRVYYDQMELYKDKDMAGIFEPSEGEAGWDYGQGSISEPFMTEGENAVAALLFGERR